MWIALATPLGGARVTAVWAQRASGDGAGVLLPSPAPLETRRARVGAARALRLVDAEGRALLGDLSEPHWETRGGGLFFTRDFGGTRNIWRAFPDPRDASRYPRWRALPVTQFVAPLFAAGACPLEGDRALLMRSNAANPRGAAQVTRFDLLRSEVRALTNVPDDVFGIAPSPDGQWFAFTAATRTRTLAPRRAPNTNSARNPLRRGARGNAPSRGAANASRAPMTPLSEFSMAVWTQSLRSEATQPTLVASNAWRPAWQNSDSLLVEGIANGVANNTIFRLSLAALGPQKAEEITFARGTQVSASRDGSTLVFVGANGDASQLYLLASDGSGQRALTSTENAQSPALASDGRAVAFTAPLGQGRGEKARALWVLPLPIDAAPLSTTPLSNELADPFTLDSTPPVEPTEAAPLAAMPAPLESVESLRAAVQAPPLTENPEIMEYQGPKNQASPIERGSGARGSGEMRPSASTMRSGAPVALIRAVQNAPGGALAIWGTASGRDASATLEIGQGSAPKRWEARPIVLPLAPDEPLLLWNPPLPARGVWNFRLSVSGSGGAAQSVFAVQLPLAPRPTPPPNRRGTFGSVPGANSTLAANGVTGAPATGAPMNRSTLNGTTSTNAAGSLPAGGPLPAAPLPDLPAAPLPSPAPLPPLLPLPSAPQMPRAIPGSGGQIIGQPVSPSVGQLGALPPRPPASNPAPSSALAGRDAATFNVSDTLAQMKVGQRVSVTFWALNRGTRAWLDAARRGNYPGAEVRLVTRWIRFDNGNRNGWTYQTMKTAVGPNARANWKFELVAPTQPGRYKLIYSLQRVTPGWAPPAYNALQETWPGDFAAIAFAVTVKS